MSILGIIVRTRADRADGLHSKLTAMPGVELAAHDGGRFVVVIEDDADTPAAATMAQIAQLPEVLNTSLVYEYSGPDSAGAPGAEGFDAWRRDLRLTARKPA